MLGPHPALAPEALGWFSLRLGPASTKLVIVHTTTSIIVDNSKKFPKRSGLGVGVVSVYSQMCISSFFVEAGVYSAPLKAVLLIIEFTTSSEKMVEKGRCSVYRSVPKYKNRLYYT